MSGEKVSTDGGKGLSQNPFGGLSSTVAPKVEEASSLLPSREKRLEAASTGAARVTRGRVDIRRETQGRGGKTVTVISGFTGIGLPEKEDLAKRIRSAAGSGGTVKDGKIEIQGDKREVAARILSEAGFRPVFAGG